MKSFTASGCIGALMFSSLLLSGCAPDNSPKSALASVNKSNIQRLGNLYNRFQSEHKWVGPASEDEFRKYVANMPPERLDMLGVNPNDIEGLFKSERDNEPFVFRYKVVGSAMGKVDPVVFEKVGAGGKKMIGFTNKAPVEADDDKQYNDWIAGKYVHSTPARGGGGNIPGRPTQ